MKKRHIRYLCGLLMPSLCVLVIAAVLLFYVYGSGVNAIREDIENTNAGSAKSICASIDTITASTRANAINLALQAAQKSKLDVAQFSLYNDTIGRILQLELSTLNMLNPVNGSSYIFQFSDDSVISKGVSGTAQDIYEKYLSVDGMTYDAFKEKYTHAYCAGNSILSVSISKLGVTRDCWLIAQSVPANPYETITGVVFVVLDDYQIEEILQDGITANDSLCMLTDSEGRIVYRQGKSSRLTVQEISTICRELMDLEDGVYCPEDGCAEGMLLCVNRTQAGLTLITARSAGEALGRMNSFTAMIFTVLAVMVVLSLTLAVMLARKNTSSVNEIINMIPNHYTEGNNGSALEYIRSSTGTLVKNVRKLEEENIRNTDMLRNIRFNRFLNGGYASRSELIRDEVLPEVLDNPGCFTVMLISSAVPDTEISDTEALQSVVSGEFDCVFVPAADSACFILRTQDPDISESVRYVCHKANEVTPVYAVVSDTVNDIMDIPEARKDILLAAGFVSAEAGQVYFYADLYTDRNMYSYDYYVFMETRLKNTITAGNTGETERAFDTMYENIAKCINSASRLRFIVYDLYRLAGHMSMLDSSTEKQKEFCDTLAGSIDSACGDKEHFNRYYESIRRFCIDLCALYSNKKEESASSLKDKINEYIDSHFSDPDMCVGTIASEFGLTDKYISQFFKEQMNEKLSVCIERKRLSHACNLLKQGVPVEEVAKSSGYWQTHTFRVAFKRVYGVTPTEFREMNI